MKPHVHTLDYKSVFTKAFRCTGRLDFFSAVGGSDDIQYEIMATVGASVSNMPARKSFAQVSGSKLRGEGARDQ